MKVVAGWRELYELLENGRADEAVAALRALPEDHRAALAAEIAALPPRDGWWSPQRVTAYAAAIVGCAPSAARAAVLIARNGWPGEGADPAPAVAAGRDRGVPWLADLGNRLAARLPRTNPGSAWALPAGLLRAAGAPPSLEPRFVDGWLTNVRPGTLPADPFAPALLIPALDRDAAASARHFLPAVAALYRDPTAAGDAAGRTAVLDRCLAVLLDRARRPGVHRAFGRLLSDLAPTPAEVRAHAGAYLRLLADGPGPAALQAQAALRGLGDAIDGAALLDAAQGVLMRAEKGLVRAQIAWLDDLAAAHPDANVRHGAADLLAAHRNAPASAFAARDEPTVTPAATAPPAATARPDAVTMPMPMPIGSADELAEEVAALDAGGDWSAVGLERIVEALVRLRAADPGALAAALAPVMGRATGELRPAHAVSTPREVGVLLGIALRVAAGLDPHRELARRTLAAGEHGPGGLAPSNPYVKLHGVVALRLAELAVRLDGEPVPELLAAPTHTDGGLDAGILAGRRARFERAGAVPWPHDLAQALYRAQAAPDPYGLAELPPRAGNERHGAHWAVLWPAVLPGRRELVAAYLLPALAGAVDGRFPADVRLLPLLADMSGPTGPATAAALAYGLAAPDHGRRAAAVDALLALAGGCGLDAAATGAAMAELAIYGVAPPGRAATVLADVARTDPGLARSLAGGVVTALTGAPAPPSRGTSRLLAAARRLRDAIEGAQ
ncbi:MAG TPA: hypothetical protein VL738_01235 [Dactylosporangium sp.]|nr:hypothetical protein [Dactylosporangium sp.]